MVQKALHSFQIKKKNEQCINISSEKHFHDRYYYAAKQNIKNYPVELDFDIDIEGEIDT